MSGKTKKQDSGTDAAASASEQKDVKNQKAETVQAKPASLAPAPSVDGQALQLPETAGDDASAPQPDGSNGGLTLMPVTTNLITAEGSNLQVDGDVVITASGEASALKVGTVHIADDVAVLEVRAIPESGFHRAGRFWPHDTVHIFVSDDPDAQVPQDDQGNPLYGCVISTVDAARLKAEKMLIVTELKPVQDAGAEED